MKFASRTISPVPDIRVCLPVRVICSKAAVPSLISLPNFLTSSFESRRPGAVTGSMPVSGPGANLAPGRGPTCHMFC